MVAQDTEKTKILLVTLPETTPISEAAALQEDLRRAGVEPFGPAPPPVPMVAAVGCHTSCTVGEWVGG